MQSKGLHLKTYFFNSLQFMYNTDSTTKPKSQQLTTLAAVCVCVLSRVSDSLLLHRLQPARLLHGISQARVLEWIAISFSRGSSPPRGQTSSLASPVLAGGFFTTGATWEAPSSSSNNTSFFASVLGKFVANKLTEEFQLKMPQRSLEVINTNKKLNRLTNQQLFKDPQKK